MSKSNEHRRESIRRSLLQAAGPDADSAAVVDASIAAWQRMTTELASIIGEGGVDALYARCLYLQRITTAEPGNESDANGAPAEPFHAVRLSLQGREPADTVEASAALLDAFIALLSSLIGEALAGRLLSPVWADERPDAPAQESLP